jgi:ketosteroid isomerase-like protein
MSTERTLIAIEKELCDGTLSGSTTAFETYVSDKAVFTGPFGTTYGKKDVVALFKSGTLKYESSVNDDMKVVVIGDTAVVTYRSTDKGVYGTDDISGKYRWTDTFAKINGKWMIVAAQGTPIKE